MRRSGTVMSFVVVLAFALSFIVGCGGGATPTPTANPTTAAGTATPNMVVAATVAPTASVTPTIRTNGAVAGDSTGVADKEILVGGTFPLSGPLSIAAAVGKGIDAYFKWLNDQGGINGRKITFKMYDDAYQAAKTIQVTKQAVEEDKVFVMLCSLGTAPQLGMRDYLNEKKVPQLWPFSGNTSFAADYAKYPWTTGGGITNNRDEALAYAKYLLANKPAAKVGFLYQNDDMGKEFLSVFKEGLGDRAKAMVVAEQSFEAAAADVNSQIQNLKAAGADVLFVAGLQAATAKALNGAYQIGWNPLKIIGSSGSGLAAMLSIDPNATKDSITVMFYKDPSDPSWDNDEGMKLHKSIMAKYCPDCNIKDAQHIAGQLSANLFEQMIRGMGKDLTREGVMKAAKSLNIPSSPFLLPGIAMKSTETDTQPIRAFKMAKFENQRWNPFGEVVDARAK